MKKISRWWVITIVVMLIAGGALGFGYYRTQSSQSNALANVQTAKIVRGNIANFVNATGSVRTNQSAVVGWQTSGRVGVIKVKVGDQVTPNMLLASLDPKSLSSSMISAQSDLIAAQQALDNLINSKVAEAQARVNELTAQQAMTNSLVTQTNLNDLSGSQASLNAQSQLENAQGLVVHLQNLYQSLPSSSPDKPKVKYELGAAINKRDKAQALVDLYGGNPTDLQLQLAQAQVDLAEAQLQDAIRAEQRLSSGPAADDIAAAKAKVASIQATLNTVSVTAPFTGTVTEVDAMPGDLVSPGTVAFHIDDKSGLFVDLQVSEVDINSVKVSQPVSLTLDAIPNQTYTGKVVAIGEVATVNNGAVYYTVTVQYSDADARVKAGMTASANVMVEQKLAVLLVPSQAVRTFNNRSYVEVISGSQMQRVIVQTGLTNDTDTEVSASQLKEGELVALSTVARSTSSSFNLFRMFGIGGAGGAGGAGTFNRGTGGGTGGNPSGGNRSGGSGTTP